MTTTIVVEQIPPELLADLRDGYAHAKKLRENASKLQEEAIHGFGQADGVEAEVQRQAERKLQAGKRDMLNLHEGTISRVVEAPDLPSSPPAGDWFEPPANEENPDGA